MENTAKATAELASQAKDELLIAQHMESLQQTSVAARAEASRGQQCAQSEEALADAAKIWEDAARRAKTMAERQRTDACEHLKTTNEQVEEAKKGETEAEKRLKEVASRQSTGGGVSTASSDTLALCLEQAALEEEIGIVTAQLQVQRATAARYEAACSAEQTAAHRHSVAVEEIASLEDCLNTLVVEQDFEKRRGGLNTEAEEAANEAAHLHDQLRNARSVTATATTHQRQAQCQLNKAAAHGALNISSGYGSLTETTTTTPTTTTENRTEAARLAARAVALRLQEQAAISSSAAASGNNALQTPLPHGLVYLQDCFQFTHAASQYSAALEVLCGRCLHIAIAKTSQHAAHVIDSGEAKGLRIWALDAVSSSSVSAQSRLSAHRAAAAAFPQGDVIVPMDSLLTFDTTNASSSSSSSLRPALEKAFGTHVIVSSVAVGRAVLNKFNVPSICAADSTVIARGRLTGGWVPPENRRNGRVHSKITSDAMEAVHLERQQVEAAAAALEQKIKQQLEADACMLAYEESQTELKSATAAVNAAAMAEAALEAELAVKERRAVALRELNERPAAQQIPFIRAQIEALQSTAAVLEKERAVAAAEVVALSSSSPPSKSENDELENRLCSLHRQHAAAKAEILKFEEQHQQQHRQASAMYASAVEECQRELRAAQQRHAERAAQSAALAEKIKYLDNVIVEQFKDVTVDEVNDQDSSGGGGDDNAALETALMAVDAAEHRLSTLEKELNTIQKTKNTANTNAIALANHRAAEIAESELALLTVRRQSLQLGAQRLKEGIAVMSPHAELWNETMFINISDFFSILIHQILPSVDVKVVKHQEEEQVEESQTPALLHRNGARFWHRRHGTKEWIAGLEALSGGQRTLISLAFLVAARSAGGGGGSASSSSSSVLLADEIDASLDGTNQEKAAQLMKIMCTKNGLAQVLCVSHSAVFQQRCDHIIKIKRGDHGGTVFAG